MAKDYLEREEENAPDMLPKPIPTNKFKNYLDLISVCNL